MDALERAKRDVVIANRILALNNVLDAYGHVSLRHPHDPQKYLLSVSMSPGIVTVDDVIEFHLDGKPVHAEERPLYLERFIHGAVYEKRADVMSVLHSHADDVLPFTISKTTKFRPVIHNIGDIGPEVPVWDIADKFGDDTNLLVTNIDHGRDLATCLACNRMALMRGHGFVLAGLSASDLVRLAVFVPRNARVLTTAMAMGEYRALSRGEIEARLKLDHRSPAMRRGWEFWAREAGVADLL